MSISLDITFFIQLVNFLISLFIINVLIIRPIRSNMARRKAMIDADTESAESFAKKMNAQYAEYEERIAKVRSQIAEQRESVKTSAEESARTALSKANDEARAIRQESAQKIQKESKEALESLQADVSSYSKEALAKILA